MVQSTCNPRSKKRIGPAQGGFSVMEATVAAAVVGVMFAALLTGLTTTVGRVQYGQQQSRATQIMAEKLDIIRMYRWDRIVNGSYVAANFTESYFPVDSLDGVTNSISPGVTYRGTISIKSPTMTEQYTNYLREVTVTLSWLHGNRPVQRQMTTYVSRYGLQAYVP